MPIAFLETEGPPRRGSTWKSEGVAPSDAREYGASQEQSRHQTARDENGHAQNSARTQASSLSVLLAGLDG